MSGTSEFVIWSLVWSAVGFIAGYYVSWSRIRHRLLPAKPDQRSWERTVGVAILVLAIATTVTSSYSIALQHRVETCQATYNMQFAAALKARSLANDVDSMAVTRMVAAVAAVHTPAQAGVVAEALSSYLATEAQVTADRAANPLPEPPASTCR